MGTKKQTKFSPALLLIGVTLIAVLAGGGYYYISNQSGSIKTGAGKIQYQAGANEKEAVVKGEDGSIIISGENVKLPNDYPGDLPQYPGSKNTMITYKPGDHLMMSILGTTTDTPEKVISWYTSELKKSGWTIEIVTSDSISMSKDDALGGVNVISSESDGVVINASIMPKNSEDWGTQNLDSDFQDTKQMLYDTKKSDPEVVEDVQYINEEGLDQSEDINYESY